MSARRALVVDDSRTARVILRRMLEQHKLVVDTAESAQDALDYLTYERPHVIFMDHMMPGMDGFQAVKAIKNDPKTAMIPIMMYTSKGGEVYLGEARALGAVGVLNKQVQPVELLQVLQRLHLLEEESRPVPQESPAKDTVIKFPKPQASLEYQRPLDYSLEIEELRLTIRRLLEEQRGKIKQDVRDALEIALDTSARGDNPSERTDRPFWQSRAAVTTLLGAAVVLLVPLLWYLSRPAGDALPLPKESGVNTAIMQPVMPTTMEDNSESGPREALEAYRVDSNKEKAILYDALEWAINNTGEYGFNELPLNDERLTTMYELISRLSAVGFEGVLRIAVHGGQFCLARNAYGGYDMPAVDAPLSACELMDASRNASPAIADLQSLAFANFLSSSPLVNDGKIQVQIVSNGQNRPLFGYPPRATVRNAGEWNRIAQRNNRVEISIIPSAV
jgi:CheY-like chemotaxis protein